MCVHVDQAAAAAAAAAALHSLPLEGKPESKLYSHM